METSTNSSKPICALPSDRQTRLCLVGADAICYNPAAYLKEEAYFLETYLNLATVITSIALIAIIILQSRGAGLGGLGGGGDFGGGSGFHVRRGIERLLFNVTIGLSFVFFLLSILNVILVG